MKALAASAFAAAAVIALASTEAGAVSPLESPVRPRLLVLGNSLVTRLPDPANGWAGSWGMAASVPERDFAHVLADRLGAELTADTLYPFEQQYATASAWTPQAAKNSRVSPDWLVIKIGDNVDLRDLPGYEAALGRYIDTVRGGAVLVCVGTWYPRPVDDATRRACEARGGKFVAIGDLYFDFTNHALSERFYPSSGVGSHPGDLGMSRIAERVYRAIVTRRYWCPWIGA